MGPRDFALTLLVVTVWGLNFIVIKAGVGEMSPMLLGALRFAAVVVPGVFFFRMPKIPLRLFLIYGLTMSVGQFAFTFTAIHIGMPSGLTSLVLQSQSFFTMLFAAWWLKEPWRPSQLAGLVLASCGLALIGSTQGVAMPLAGFLLALAAASMWSLGNIVTRFVSRAMVEQGETNFLAFIVWAGWVPLLCFSLASWWLDGSDRIVAVLTHFNLKTIVVVLYLGWMATLVGYGIWSRLLVRYPLNLVAPFPLLVPLIGLTAGWLVYGERLLPAHFAGSALLMLGLVVNLFGARMLAWLRFRF